MRVLIVKLSSLGDVVHAMPVVHDIRAAHPDAVIDWVVEPAFAPLVRRVDGIGEVIDCALRRWRARWWAARSRSEWRAFRAALATRAYDAMFDLQGLTKSALVARLARGRSYGLANRTEGSSHEAPARWLVDHPIELPARIHALDRSRVLVARVLGTQVKARRSSACARDGREPAQPTLVFVHGSSRDDKLWPESHWIALGRRSPSRAGTSRCRTATSRAGARRTAGAAIDSELTAFLDTGAGAGAAVQVWPRMKIDALVDRIGARTA